MKMEGDKNSGVMDKPKAFNQPDEEGTHAWLSKQIKKDANEAVRSSTTHAHTFGPFSGLFSLLLFPSFSTHLLPGKATGVRL